MLQKEKNIYQKNLPVNRRSINHRQPGYFGAENVPPEEIDSVFREMQEKILDFENQNQVLLKKITTLENASDHYSNLYHHAPVGYLTINENNIIIEANEKIASMLGVDIKKLIRQPFTRYIVREDLDFFRHYKENFLKSVASTANEIELRRADGLEFWARTDWSMDPKVTGGLRNIHIAVSDINERKSAAEELRQMVEENFQHTEELEAIFQISAAMKHASNQSELIPILINQTIRVMGASQGILMMMEGDSYFFYTGSGSIQGTHIRKNGQSRDLLWGTINHEKPVFIKDIMKIPVPIRNTPLFSQLFSQTRCYCLAPLKMDQNIFGLLILGFPSICDFSIYQERLASAISDMAGSALYRINTTEILKKMVTDRTRELDSIYRVSTLINENLDLKTLLEKALGNILESIKSQGGAILLKNESNGSLERVADKGEIPLEVIENLTQQSASSNVFGWIVQSKDHDDIPVFSEMGNLSKKTASDDLLFFGGFPICDHQNLLGVLIILYGNKELTQQEIAILSYYANHLALMIENFSLHKQEESMIIKEERLKIAGNLHDMVSQSLFAASLYINSAENSLESNDKEQLKSLLKKSSRLMEQCLTAMRLMIYELRSPMAKDSGLIPALENRLNFMENKMGVQVKMEKDELLDLDPSIAEGVYHSIIEVLNNALFNSKIDHLHVNVRYNARQLSLEVKEDRPGYGNLADEKSWIRNLPEINERIRHLNGSLVVSSNQDGENHVKLLLPVQAG